MLLAGGRQEAACSEFRVAVMAFVRSSNPPDLFSAERVVRKMGQEGLTVEAVIQEMDGSS